MISKLDKGVNKSNILNIDLFSMKEWFENLIGIKKIAVCLILGLRSYCNIICINKYNLYILWKYINREIFCLAELEASY
jgi:hypothetical protein